MGQRGFSGSFVKSRSKGKSTLNESKQENKPDIRQEYRQNQSPIPYRRKSLESSQPKEEPIVFGVIVIQVCICIFVLARAFILKGFGGSNYETVRSYYQNLVTPGNLQVEMNNPQDYADKMNQLEKELAQIPDQFTLAPQQDEDTEESQSKSEEEKNSEDEENSEASHPQESGAGGQHSVSYVSLDTTKPMEKQKWPAPEGTALSPFFVTATPISPVDGTITSPYGYRIHPITGELDFHTGLDIAAPNNTPIRAILPGTVKEIGESEIYGNYIVVAHQNGFESVYNHCESITAQVGTVVRQGDWIARVGSTGLSTGNHVHLDLKINGVYVNPYLAYIGAVHADISDT